MRFHRDDGRALAAWLETAFAGHGVQATSAEIAALEHELGFQLYAEHRSVLLAQDRPEAFVGERYVAFWSLTEIRERLAEAAVSPAGWVPFASDGGGECYGYDCRQPGLPRLARMPAIAPNWDDAIDFGVSWAEWWNALRGESR